MGKTELFLEKYKALESAIALAYKGEFEGGAAVSWLERRKEFKNLSAEIKCCRETRNLLQHNVKVGGKYAVLPDDALLNLLDELRDRVENPALCKDFAVLLENVFYRELGDNVRKTMYLMKKFGYTHVPILSDGRVIGVFSEHTAFNFFLEKYEDKIDADTSFADIFELISLEKGTGEIFRFESLNTRLSEIEDIFEEGIEKNEKIKMVFLTENGRPEEKLAGIISHWDIIGI